MIPYRLTRDAGWTGDPVITSFIPSSITDREWYVYGYDDRRFMYPGIKEGVRLLNRWYNEGLIWEDFTLHPAGDPMGDDLIRLGYVGSFIGNWDLPFRPAEAFQTHLRDNIGPHARFIPITPFTNDAGIVRKFFPNPTDRFIFFPSTNRNPLASLIYLDWISRPDVREFLQFGIEGVHRRTLPNGAILTLGETDTHSWPDHQFIPSLRNFDITMTINGIALDDPYLTVATLALGYPGTTPEEIMAARSAGLDNATWFRQVMTRTIEAQTGMSGPLADQRDVLLHTIIAGTNPANFDSEWTRLYQNYLNLGAAAIIREREAAWVEQFGNVDRMP
jgi:putative aldouronate transport system substrate-binding protein